MADAALTLILILGPCLTHACILLSVTQNPPIIATLNGKEVEIRCEVKLKGNAPAVITSVLYRDGRTGAWRPGERYPAENMTISYSLTATEPGVYYCGVTCGVSSMTGHGTYVYVRDSGYVAPSSSSYKLCCALIALSILLLILAASWTYLVLPFIWKREVTSASQTKAQSSGVTESSTSRPAVEDAGGSLYTSLEPRREEVYDILEDETRTKEPRGTKKHQVEVHDVAPRSPMRRHQVNVPPFQEKKLKENASENSVYENMKR
ncbi:NFAT activation molecule 1 [Bufo bufo]|uniref:NFAT activation molecule 1 n=1 Tax=Bufo bufo TaxID=8384 RepID=UPI001ABEB6A6|nr:NFAT activation molecule 1 [Bufo bufo]